jgi:hypothetical protein
VTHIYLAGVSRIPTLDAWDWVRRPLNLLVAFPFIRSVNPRWAPARMMLDSGAWSVWNSGDTIDLAALARESMKPRWTEAVSLDVIGDWQASQRNAVAMRLLGSPAIPVFHIDDPWPLLEFYCAHWPKVGLGGMVGLNRVGFKHRLQEWLSGVFERAWPHRFHAFGLTDPYFLLRFPFDSADSSTWTTVTRFPRAIWGCGDVDGAIRQIDIPSVPSAIQAGMMRLYIHRYLELQDQVSSKWAKELSRVRDR